MKPVSILLSLVALLTLAGCQTAKAPENGEESEAVVESAVQDESANVTATEPASEEEDTFVNPNYDAKLDGDPTKAPTVEQDKEDGNEDDSKASTTKVDQSFMSDPNQ